MQNAVRYFIRGFFRSGSLLGAVALMLPVSVSADITVPETKKVVCEGRAFFLLKDADSPMTLLEVEKRTLNSSGLKLHDENLQARLHAESRFADAALQCEGGALKIIFSRAFAEGDDPKRGSAPETQTLLLTRAGRFMDITNGFE